MRSNIFEFIKSLSENDTKDLIGKTLKTSEEVGELAKAVLPYENAAGTLHRFVQRREILDSAADVILCALSIAYDLKYTDEEILDMMHEKATKWSGLQIKEGKVKFPLPFEIHVTVDLNAYGSLDSFKAYCIQHGLKPIIIELEKNGEVLMNDVMTSSVHYGDNNTAMAKAHSIANNLKREDYLVTRVKIETVPWHPAAPSTIGSSKMPDDSYFESHLRIVCKKEDKVILQRIANQFDAHLSRNYFKKLNDNEFVIMMTLRSYKDLTEVFIEKVDKLKRTLQDAAFAVDKTEIEFAVYDSNVTHDIEWIRG